MNADGSNVKQLTNERGYDGGPSGLTMARKSSTAPSIPIRPRKSPTYKDLLSKGSDPTGQSGNLG